MPLVIMVSQPEEPSQIMELGMVSGTFADANVLQPSPTLYDHCLTLIVIVVLSPLHGSIKKESHRNNTERRLPLNTEEAVRSAHRFQSERLGCPIFRCYVKFRVVIEQSEMPLILLQGQ